MGRHHKHSRTRVDGHLRRSRFTVTRRRVVVGVVALTMATVASTTLSPSRSDTGAPAEPGVPAGSSSAPADADPPRGTLSDGTAYSARGIPARGAHVGAAVGANTNPAAFESELGRRLGLRRTYWRADQVDKALTAAGSDLAAGRLPWLSFKLPASWREMAAGAGDAWALNISTRLAALRGPVWVAFHHEPEGDGDITAWVQAQKRLSPIVRGNAPNVAFTIILTGYHQLYGNPRYSLDAVWPGDGLVDVIGLDLYNNYGVVRDGVRSTRTTDPTAYFEKFSAFAKRKKAHWGLAETGITDRAAKNDPQWLTRTYDGLVAHGGVVFTYFNTNLNSRAAWHLESPEKMAAFAAVLRRAPTLPAIG